MKPRATAGRVRRRRSLKHRLPIEVPPMKRLILGITATTMTAFLALTACETSPKDGGLLPDARNAVAHAEADPNVLKYAPTELDRARKLLVNAESSAKAKGASDT